MQSKLQELRGSAGRAGRAASDVLVVVRRLGRIRQASAGAAIVIVAALIAILAPVIAPYDPLETNLRAVLAPPSLEHLFGTDELGRDILSRVVHGSGLALQVGFVAVTIAVVLGVSTGLLAGYWGGWVDNVIMRIMDGLLAFPLMVLALAITAALGPSLMNAMIAIGVTYTPYFSRLVRGQTLSVREYEYVAAARLCGASDLRIIWRHIWPNVAGPVIVQV